MTGKQKVTFSPTPIKKFPNIYSSGKGRRQRFLVKSGAARPIFDEQIISFKGRKYREVDPNRSKLFAAIAKDISQIGLKEDSSVLYLGASHGYTVSFLAEMVAQGSIYALDFAPRVVRDLVFVAEEFTNVAPIMADANQPQEYKESLCEEGVDVVFMDIAQKDQVGIFLKNCDAFLKKGGFGLLALKARSEDVTKKPRDVFKQVRKVLDEKEVVVDYRELAPYEKDHALFVMKKK
ncbi:MAG: fibrillarin-like rRNA/tRNA 2'-O-methyltransferase [Candidatus Woesearchaeota archaeon]